jgi:undecaprenyl-diphosphatase
MAHRARAAPSRPRGRLSVGEALVLGLIQGPAELLPVSSSGHLVLVPALLDWRYARLPADVRKAFEVALHTGAGLALVWLLRAEALAAARDPLGTALLTAPAAGAGFMLEPLIEERLSDAKITAIGQIAAGCALAAAELTAPKRVRPLTEVKLTPRRRLAVGLAQALALVPGVSRNGATFTAARALGFDRATSLRLSWRGGLPIIGGATALKLVRLRQSALDRSLRAPFAAGAAAALASTIAAAPLLRLLERRSYVPIAAYRVALGAVALRRLDRLEWPRD